ncbi:MAG: hydantoinase B/oxoprolinase family protein [Rhodospirillales bacterium]|nr:hydantoinase B/oxoprolinase family protein [Rhodospirillales bacterium]MDP6773091.1 hydantoinase B/oxoprolinase family protein [Rhodospirillales bacterium]
MTKIDDLISFEMFKNAIFSIADEMAVTICRTTYSGILRDNMDFATAIANAEGRLVAQGLTLPFHLGSMHTAIAAVMARYGDDIGAGDVFILNDPFAGGMHLPDIFIIKPVFADGQRIAFVLTTAHHGDVGGRVPGSNAADSTEIYQEGLRLPPLKLIEGGARNETLWTVIETNVRLPVRLFGDLRAQLAACEVAEKQFLEQVARYGTDTVKVYMAEVMDYAERLARAAVSELPDGEFSFEDWIDDDGVEFGKPIRLFVTVRKEGDRMSFDWTGSAKQVKGAINSTLSVTQAASYTALRSILPGTIPNNDGVFRVIDVTAPPGTITNVVLPGACAARALTGFRMLDCAFGALARMSPELVGAAGDGGNVGVSIGGYDKDRKPFIYVDFACGTWGGRPWADGLEGNTNLFINMASQSIEVTESEHPIEILAYELAGDRCGAGKYRGGAPFYRDYRLGEKDAVLQVRADRQVVRPYGLYGGKPGKPGSSHFNPETEDRKLPSKVTMDFHEGEVMRYVIAGGGGWGDALERDADLVLNDARNEIISVEAARLDYGVVIDAGTWAVDGAATDKLRDDMRTARGGAEAPFVSRED